jgi:hypothetical protein
MEISSGSTDKLPVFVSQENKNYIGFDYREQTFKFAEGAVTMKARIYSRYLCPSRI